MVLAVILAFAIGYLAIVFEHPLKVDKTVSAFAMGAAIWAILALGFHHGVLTIIDAHGHKFNAFNGMTELLEEQFSANLLHHLGAIAEILVFLIGAMTIVELIDTHKGFEVIKKLINTKKKIALLWIISIIGFFLSAVIDNLTATIVLITVLRKLITSPKERMWYAGLIVIAANAGGAWSPIGDVTTTMLWISKKVSVNGLVGNLFLPSIICAIVPILAASLLPAFKGSIEVSTEPEEDETKSYRTSTMMLILGLGAILFVPIFKTITHLPPYIGMMLSLSFVWLIAEFSSPLPHMTDELKEKFEAKKALSKIDLSSILFFLGILLAVAGLESLCLGDYGSLRALAENIKTIVPNTDIVAIILGVISAIIDNVPLVAASIGMFTDAMDSKIWHLIAFSAGTGGSMLIIGSAAGVAAMGMEKIDFIWYFKNITWLAALGFISGILVFLAQSSIVG